MSTPWGGAPQEPHRGGSQYGPPSGAQGGQQPYGQDVQPYGSGPVDPYAGQAAPPVPAYHQYVNPGSWEPAPYFGGPSAGQRQGVPGTIIAGSIVGYLLALFLFTSGCGLVFFGSITAGSFDELDSSLGDGGTSLVIAGLGNWIAMALFITGGVMASLRRPAGAIVIAAASALVVLLAVYWVVLYPESGIVFWAGFHVLLAAIPAGLAVLPPSNRAWLNSRTQAPPTGPAPYPTDQYGRPFGS